MYPDIALEKKSMLEMARCDLAALVATLHAKYDNVIFIPRAYMLEYKPHG